MSKKSDLPAWFLDQYRESVGLSRVESGAAFKRFAEPFPAPPDGMPNGPYPSTPTVRANAFLGFKFRYPIGRDGYTCLALEASLGDSRTHYAYAYWRREREDELPEYICVSPTFDSRDGEYRRRFIRYPAFAAAYEKLAELFAPFEEHIVALVAQSGLRLRAVAYPADRSATALDRASELRLIPSVFAVALVLDLNDISQGLLMVHTNAAYVRLVKAVAQHRPELVRLGDELRQKREVEVFWRGTRDLTALQCGQKLVPMFTREAMQAFDYNLAAWRELAVAKLVGDFVINYISPAFSIYNQWTYVEGANETLFENRAMRERYQRGRAAEQASRSLREARAALGAESALLNYHTEALGAQVYDSLEYAQSFLVMSPVAIAHTMEDVGWSLHSTAARIRRANTQWPAAVEAFATRDSVARYLFDVAYGAHCLHAKLGVAHTDLHENNMTFYLWGFADAQKAAADGKLEFTPYYSDPVVAYVLGDDARTYVFPATGATGCLIDFSRCILGPGFRPRLEADRSPSYADHFFRDQVSRVMRTLHRYAPGFVKSHEAAIRAAVLANFDAVFPILCAVDFIAIGHNVASSILDSLATVDEYEKRPFLVSQEGVALARRLEKAATDLFITGLHDLAEGAAARLPAAPFPGEDLLARVFTDWRFPTWAANGRAKTAQLVDAYNFNNPLRYSATDYAKFPPWARLDEIERHLGEHKITDLFERGVEPFLEALRPGAVVDIVAEQIRAEQEALDGRPPAPSGTSWLDE
jgi:hypothetical protein